MTRPLIVWKYAASLDDRTAARYGTSEWITSEESRADVHRLRAEPGAIMVGSGTMAADNPSLTVRHV
jgi:diaminohydroxyphosphoribosylaminopyrimidine deaminase / 5-amino-6-(5-phosphoribosylamino)uracil reductase